MDEKAETGLSYRVADYSDIDIFLDGQIIGSASVHATNKELSWLTIDNPYRGKGYGQQVARHLIEKYGITCLYVSEKDDAAKHIFTKNQFIPTEHDYDNDLIRMEKVQS